MGRDAAGLWQVYARTLDRRPDGEWLQSAAALARDEVRGWIAEMLADQ